MVGVDGLEPSRCYHQWFLRPPCLPIPAHAQIKLDYNFHFFSIKLNFKLRAKIKKIVKYKDIGAYGLVQQNNIKNRVNFINKFENSRTLKLIFSIIKNKDGIVIKTS